MQSMEHQNYYLKLVHKNIYVHMTAKLSSIKQELSWNVDRLLQIIENLTPVISFLSAYHSVFTGLYWLKFYWFNHSDVKYPYL